MSGDFDSGRKIYLNKKSLKEAIDIFKQYLSGKKLKTEIISTCSAVGRITAEEHVANRSAPHFYASAMDGFAVKSQETEEANERNPVKLKISRDALEVNTGSPIPEDFDAVIKIENVEFVEDEFIKIYESVSPWNNLRSIGESILKGEQVVTSHTRLNAAQTGALLEAGITEVEVFQKPFLKILPTGDEIVPPEKEPEIGEIVEFNSQMISSRAEEVGAQVEIADICPDDPELLRDELKKAAAGTDMVATIAGSSAGSRDHMVEVLAEMGEVKIHGVDIMPGKPLLLGDVDGTPIIGLPGYPLSCLLDVNLFLEPALKQLQGEISYSEKTEKAVLKRKVSSSPGRDEFLRVNLKLEGDDYAAVPRRRGASSMKSLTQADGYLKISAEKEGLTAGDIGEVRLLKDRKKLEDGLVLVGSNDPALEKLKNYLAGREQGIDLKLQSRGSQAGIHSLLRGEADLAAAHLIDSDSGRYNIPYLEQVSDKELLLITLALREQGFIFRKDSDLSGIDNIEDLAKTDLRFINRQRGAGTRVLLDYKLDQKGISGQNIESYTREEYTHAAVAQAVSVEKADITLGIRAAAEAFDLEFKPVLQERFELIYPASSENDWRFEMLIEAVKSEEFNSILQGMKGYNSEKTGEERTFLSSERGD
ncbi:molybdopterin biosynthesis protein [Halarsenatibacter silvermanii]|uniref:Molybdopterin molybdenumtransferase n=1 Tax=Halarsenatibacter silvermanii TaxID=321763 RepID=A0A1G9P8I2_9FIRM|nr:molybdopterin biosynthesis protein [Halarsenatibacter silvermanii]SDL95096.1 molybdopterin molybdochelatase [Halarsenatibacter silvermanii]